VLPRRYVRTDGHSAFTDSERHLILAAETLRAGDSPPKRKDGEKTEEKISVFWRVFGGTILSITALTVISAYQSLAKGIDDLRRDVGHLRETNGEYIKSSEFNSRATTMWNSIREAQAVAPSVTVLTNKTATLEGQLTAAETERKELLRELLQLRERLAKLEGLQEAKPTIKPASLVEPMKKADP
jgi:DNA repair exonuclease SbcCD ATPase subunit